MLLCTYCLLIELESEAGSLWILPSVLAGLTVGPGSGLISFPCYQRSISPFIFKTQPNVEY
jgi:hypothetical protein